MGGAAMADVATPQPGGIRRRNLRALTKAAARVAVNFKTAPRTIFYDNGDCFEGQYRSDINKAEGHGEFKYAAGGEYRGNFQDGKFNGWGTYVYTSGNTYEGDFSEGKMTGEGKMTYANGDVYEGQFKDASMHGEGMFVWSNGRTYRGKYHENKRKGSGVMSDTESGY